jgi:hypothetical protein
MLGSGSFYAAKQNPLDKAFFINVFVPVLLFRDHRAEYLVMEPSTI